MERDPGASLDIRLLGPVRVLRGGTELPIPRSRKVRALLALLALERAPISRSRLCDLLFEVPNDPRAELRWYLSKLRGVLDDEDRRRVVTTDQGLVALELSDCRVDALELERMAGGDLSAAVDPEIVESCGRLGGDLVDGVLVDGVELAAWLERQRERFRCLRITLRRKLAEREAMKRGGLSRARADAIVDDAGDPREVLASVAGDQALTGRVGRRGSVVVMPFLAKSPDAKPMADGLTDDVITQLAKLRHLFVIARGTSYALCERGVDPREAARLLGVDYVVSGTVHRTGTRVSIRVELAETAAAGVVWSDRIDGGDADTFYVLEAIVARIAASIVEEIEREECRRALVKPPGSLDAWEAYHRGLWHMYRFTGPDNELGARFFRDALRLDPTFGRAHAGLSFTHFQNVFLGLTRDRDRQLRLAFETAGESLAIDDRDPAAHWAMGRALWLGGSHDESIDELERCVELGPNFALGHYTLGFVHAQSGDPRQAIDAIDTSRELSPFDPLKFAMLCSRALAHLRLDESDAAAEYALKAARCANAHAHILAIAASSLALVDRRDPARDLVTRVRGKVPGYGVEDLLRAFRFAPDAERILLTGARRAGF